LVVGNTFTGSPSCISALGVREQPVVPPDSSRSISLGIRSIQTP